MRPLCHYGFPCKHLFWDMDGEGGFCAHPYTHSEPPKNEKEWEETSSGFIHDASYYDCPIMDDVTISSHVERMLDELCTRCGGTGKETTLLDIHCLPKYTFVPIKCEECNGTGIETEESRKRFQERVDEAWQRMEERRAAREQEGGA